MKLKLVLLILSAALSLNAQIITGFGTGDFTVTYDGFSDPISGTQTSTTYSFSGSDLSPGLFGSFTPVSIGNPEQISLTATLSTSVNSNFQLELFDGDGNSRIYQANWSSFTPLSSEVVVPLNFITGGSGTFNGTAVSLGIVPNGSGSTVTISLNTLSAIPEPSTYAAILGVAVLGMGVCRRRRRAA